MQDIISHWQGGLLGDGSDIHAPTAAEAADNVRMFSHYSEPESVPMTDEAQAVIDERLEERRKLFEEIGF